MPSKLSLIFNAISFNACWFGLIIFGDNFIVIAAIWLVLHLLMVEKKRIELCFMLTVASIGIAVDIGLTLAQFFSFSLSSFILPSWLLTLWLCFSATLNYSLNFLSNNLALQLVVGGLIAPLSYLAGARLEAVELNLVLPLSYLILGLIWALLMPLFFALSQLISHWLNNTTGLSNE